LRPFARDLFSMSQTAKKGKSYKHAYKKAAVWREIAAELGVTGKSTYCLINSIYPAYN